MCKFAKAMHDEFRRNERLSVRTYLDTNVYNSIADIKSFWANPGDPATILRHRICLSPVNVLEILNVVDVARREMLIRVLKIVCTNEIFAEPELLLVDFIAEHSRDPELKKYRLDTPFPCTTLGSVWKDIKTHPEKTFVFNEEIRAKVEMLKLLNRLMHVWLRRGGSYDDQSMTLLGEYRNLSRSQLIVEMRGSIRKMMAYRVPTSRGPHFRDALFMLVAIILIVGVTPFPESIDNMWNAVGVTSIQDRIEYAINGPFAFVLEEGPLVGMAGLLAHQIAYRSNPGNLLDAYHISYLPYVSEFLTLDRRLLEFASAYAGSHNIDKVHQADTFVRGFDR